MSYSEPPRCRYPTLEDGTPCELPPNESGRCSKHEWEPRAALSPVLSGVGAAAQLVEELPDLFDELSRVPRGGPVVPGEKVWAAPAAPAPGPNGFSPQQIVTVVASLAAIVATLSAQGPIGRLSSGPVALAVLVIVVVAHTRRNRRAARRPRGADVRRPVMTAGSQSSPATMRGASGGPYQRVSVGDGEMAIVGEYGTALAGRGGWAEAGEHGLAKVGDKGHAYARAYGTASAGSRGIAKAGKHGRATAGVEGLAWVTGGKGAIAQSGPAGASVTGFRGTARIASGGRALSSWGGAVEALTGAQANKRVVRARVGWPWLAAKTWYRFDESDETFVAVEPR